jgi:hypothetical protein
MGFFKLASGLIMLTFVAVQGKIIFQDDFSDPANSDSNWPPQKDLQINFGSGKCSITNANATYAGLLTHTVDSKPAEFTYSTSITRSSDTIVAGLYVNSVSNAIDGFAVQLGAGSLIYVTKFGSGKSEVIFNKQSGSVNTTQSNNLMISKKSTSYYIYCNNEFIGSFTDSDISAIAVGLIVGPKSSAVFDNVVLTNSVTLPPPPSSSYADDFNDGKLNSGWLNFGKQADISEADSVLKINSKPDSVVYLVKDFTASPVCTLKVEVSHRGGSSSPLYGLFLCGNVQNNVVPVAGFGITGSSYYGISLPGSTSIDLAQSSDIRGDAYISGTDTVYKKDTLKIIGGSGNYKCYANGVCLDSFNISFPVTGVGVFCYGDLKVYFDNFYVDKAGTSVTHFIKNRHSTLNQNIFSRGNLIVDPLGRTVSISNNFNKSKIASGMYLTNKKMAGKVLITK